jgi:hypothetical protein
MAMRKRLGVVLALSLVLAAGSPPCAAETAFTANLTPPHGQPAKQPTFCFQGAAPDRQEASRYADRARRDASRASSVRAGDRDDTAFIIELVIIGAAVIVGGVVLAAHGI